MKKFSFLVLIPAVVSVLLIPLVSESFFWLDLAARILIFSLLAASFDLLLGYTGLVSFAHTMFFGIGAYAAALGFQNQPAFISGLGETLFWSIVLLIPVLALFRLLLKRLKGMFFTMTSLAVGETFLIGIKQWESFAGGHDGMVVHWPEFLASGSIQLYVTTLMMILMSFWLLQRFLKSPLGLSLQAIRENAERTEALGYRVERNRFIGFCVGGGFAWLAGVLYAGWIGFVNPEAVLGIPVMMDVLMMVIIGGAGSLYGGIIGAGVLISAQTFLPLLSTYLQQAQWHLPVILMDIMVHWRILVGSVFILIVFLFPQGIHQTRTFNTHGRS